MALVFCLTGGLEPTASEAADGAELTVPMLHDFLRGAVRGTMLHETAHALIRILDFPVVGPEEDVADEFAAMVTIAAAKRSEFGHRNALALVDASLTLWNLFKQGGTVNVGGSKVFDSSSLERYDSHSPSIRRAYHTLCLLYGAFPERYGLIPVQIGMSEGDMALCIDDYQRKARAWGRILEPYRPGQSHEMSFNFRYVPSTAPRGRFYENLYLGFLDVEWSVIRSLNAEIALPSPLPMERTDCGFENAYFDPESRRIIFCNELVHLLADGYVRNITGMGFDEWWSKDVTKRAARAFVGQWRMTSIAGPEGEVPRPPRELVLRDDGTFTWTIRFSLDEGLPRPDMEKSGLWGVEGEELWLLETSWVPSLPPDCLYTGCEPPASMDGVEARRAPLKSLGADKFDYNNGMIFERRNEG